MAEHRGLAEVDPGRGAGSPPPLPDLTDVDLRTLRMLDDPGLSVACERILRNPEVLGESWYGPPEGE